MNNKAKYGLFLVAVMVVSVLSGCIGQPPPEKKVLIYACSGDVQRLDPADVTDGESIQRMDNIFDGLVRYKLGSVEIEPALATKWEVDSTGTVWMFYLRKGVKFHDGTDFNADAVVFSLERQRDPNHAYYQYGEWSYWSWCYGSIAKTEKVDNYTVRITLKQKDATFFTTMAMFTAYIVSPANAEKYKEEAFAHPCGTGPFKFVEWVKDDHITLVANDDYWGGRPKIDELIFRVIPDTSARLLALEKGEVDAMEYPNPDDLDRIRGNPDLVLLTQPGMNVGYFALNTGYGYDENGNIVQTAGYFEPFTKKEVRQAIAHAIDKESIVKNLYKGTASVAKNMMPPGLLGYNDDIVDYEYDPALARQLLADAGYPDGFECVFWVMPVSRPYMFDPPKIGEAIQSYLAAVGIKAEIFQIEWGTYLEKTEAGEHNCCLLGWTGDIPDPDNFLYVLCDQDNTRIGTSGNMAFLLNDRIHELNILAKRTYDEAERAQYYREVQEILHEECGFITLAHANQMVVLRKNVKGFLLHPTSRIFWYSAYLEE